MSDVSQGPGWQQGSDGKWYPPQQDAGAQGAPPPPPGPGAAPQSPPPGGAFASGSTDAPPAIGPNGQPLAEWVVRVQSALIDFVVPGIVAAIISLLLPALGILLSLVALAWAVYNGYLNGETGQSIGKKVIGTRVVNAETGQLIGGGMGIARFFAHIVDGIICYVGYLFPLWDPKKQCLADKIVGTVVETGAPKQDVDANLFKS